MRVYRDWPTLTSKEELLRFCNGLPFLQQYIPGRADKVAFLKTSIIEEAVTTKINGRQTTRKTLIEFRRTTEHEQVFRGIKETVTTTALMGGDDKLQYHLCTDASKTGAGAVLFQLKGEEPGTVTTTLS